MDVDLYAGAGFLVADDDDTVAGMITLVLLDVEGEGFRLGSPGTACIVGGMATGRRSSGGDPLTGIGDGDGVRDVALDVDSDVAALHGYLKGGRVGLEGGDEGLADGDLVGEVLYGIDDGDDCLTVAVALVLADEERDD